MSFRGSQLQLYDFLEQLIVRIIGIFRIILIP
jgi:hypothetical protein